MSSIGTGRYVTQAPAAVSTVAAPAPERRVTLAAERAMFGALCVVWGTTWLAMKIGITSVPPALFSGTRWTVAGLVLLCVLALRGRPARLPPHLIGRVVAVAMLMITVNGTIQLYGLRYVSSGLGAVIGSAMTPVGLLGFSLALGQERANWRQIGAMALGIGGIFILFGPSAFSGHLRLSELLGVLAVILGCLAYAAGSVLARPLMRTMSPVHLGALTNFIGGVIQLALALAFEPGAGAAMSGAWGAPAWGAWLFLLLPGSLGATLIYLLLVRDWGASRAGTYSFISPIIAVLAGMALLGEHLHASDAAGMALMLGGAAVALRAGRRPG